MHLWQLFTLQTLDIKTMRLFINRIKPLRGIFETIERKDGTLHDVLLKYEDMPEVIINEWHEFDSMEQLGKYFAAKYNATTVCIYSHNAAVEVVDGKVVKV
jgi:hypothetical protein